MLVENHRHLFQCKIRATLDDLNVEDDEENHRKQSYMEIQEYNYNRYIKNYFAKLQIENPYKQLFDKLVKSTYNENTSFGRRIYRGYSYNINFLYTFSATFSINGHTIPTR